MTVDQMKLRVYDLNETIETAQAMIRQLKSAIRYEDNKRKEASDGKD